MAASAEELLAFVDASPTPYHCVSESARRLAKAGFEELDEQSAWTNLQSGHGFFVRRNGTLVAWRVGSRSPVDVGFRIVGAHTDSPNLRLKPNPEYVKDGILQWGVQVYGGVLTYTWFDRDLGVSGRVFTKGKAGLEPHLVRVDRPVARVASLAIHFNRTVRTEGFKPNDQRHLPPVVGLQGLSDTGALDALLAESAGLSVADIVGHDLMLHPLEPSALGGVNGEFIFAPRMDNQASCYTAIEGLLAADSGAPTAVIALFDHEECGSGSAHGGDGAFFEHMLKRIVENASPGVANGFERAAALSFMVSADMAHALHPNYADHHDGHHKPLLGGGPVIKTHVNQQYATDGETSARFKLACEAVGVSVQDFVIRTDLRCGSTIGPITSSNLGIRTVDVGCAMLSMHSIREQAAAKDVADMAAVKAHILGGH